MISAMEIQSQGLQRAHTPTDWSIKKYTYNEELGGWDGGEFCVTGYISPITRHHLPQPKCDLHFFLSERPIFYYKTEPTLEGGLAAEHQYSGYYHFCHLLSDPDLDIFATSPDVLEKLKLASRKQLKVKIKGFAIYMESADGNDGLEFFRGWNRSRACPVVQILNINILPTGLEKIINFFR